MGRRGPAPQPTALRVLRGNPGKRPLNAEEPKPRALPPKRPTWLTGEARKKWDELVPELERLGLLTIVDGAALAGLCQAWKDYVECTRFIKKHGRTFTTESGYIVPRPEVAIAQKALQAIKAFAAEFGLTPSSRSRLRTPQPERSEDEYEEFRRRGSARSG